MFLGVGVGGCTYLCRWRSLSSDPDYHWRRYPGCQRGTTGSWRAPRRTPGPSCWAAVRTGSPAGRSSSGPSCPRPWPSAGGRGRVSCCSPPSPGESGGWSCPSAPVSGDSSQPSGSPPAAAARRTMTTTSLPT